MSALPTLKYYNGFPLSPAVDANWVAELIEGGFQLYSDDVLIVTYPKSGTTWTQQVVSLIRGLPRGQEETHVTNSIPWLEKSKDVTLSLPSPRSFKCHLPYHMVARGTPADSVAKYIYVIRNPKDVAVSFYHHTKRYNDSTYHFTGDWNDYFELFLKGEVDFGSWFDHVLGWLAHKDAENILFLKYEDMKADLRGTVKSISQFMGYSLDESVIDRITEQSTFENMRSDPSANPDSLSSIKAKITKNSTPFLRKGIVGDWKNHFSDEQSARLDAEYAKRMAGSGLELRYE